MSSALADNVVGSIQLQPSTRLVFSVGWWKGQPYAHMRKFVATARYEGPTKSGIPAGGRRIDSRHPRAQGVSGLIIPARRDCRDTEIRTKQTE